MYKRLFLAVFVMLVVATFAFTALAEPSDTQSSVTSDEIGSISSTISTPSDESTESSEITESGSENSSAVSSTTSTASKYYIPDDSDYYVGNLSDIQQASGGSIPSGILPDETSSTAETSSVDSNPRKSVLKGIIGKYIWIPIGVIALCILVLVCFNRVYAIKYRPIDPIAKIKAQRKAEQRRNARSANDMGNKEEPGNKNRTHKPRD